MDDTKEVTAPNATVAAVAERPPSKDENSIPQESYDGKSFDELEAMIRKMRDPTYLATVSMRELFETAYESKPPLIDGLLYPGIYLLVGAPKIGKSFLVAQLAFHVSTGTPLWDYSVRKGTVLYLALEDDNRRLQSRMYQMFDMAIADQLYFATNARQIGKGLDEQLERFLKEHPDTKLVIIDTLYKVREIDGEAYSYASDYDIITRLKSFADCHGLCLILVHHTRKQKSADAFDMISGTNGLLGAADGAFLLSKPERTANEATLDVTGRDQQDQRLHLYRVEQKLCWELERCETELWKAPPEAILDAVAALVNAENPEWFGSPTALVEALAIDIKANALTMKLNVNTGRLYREYGIRYWNSRTHDGRKIVLRYEPESA